MKQGLSPAANRRTIIQTVVTMALAILAAWGLWAMFGGHPNAGPDTPPPGGDAPDGPPSAERPLNKAVIYFNKSQGASVALEGVVRAIPPAEKAQPLTFALSQLLKGPETQETADGYFSEIPKGTRLLSVRQSQGRYRVNLSQQFTAGGGSSSMQQRMKQLQQTILGVEKRVPVFVDIEGKQLDVLGGEGVVVQEPLNAAGVQP
ncbi:MAG: GerMN domain-containing protein [Vampirovibrionales bacterium]|nr:GerMN domain-containing protein [Vampirovibrionales bacterium]